MSIKILLIVCAALQVTIIVLLAAMLVRRHRPDRPADQEKPDQAAPAAGPNDFMKRVEDIIAENLPDCNFTVERLASMMFVSRSGLFAKVKQYNGTTPNRMILKARFDKAMDLMSDKDLTLSQISVLTGFTSPSYFSKCFAREFGESPNKWRENHYKQ